MAPQQTPGDDRSARQTAPMNLAPQTSAVPGTASHVGPADLVHGSGTATNADLHNGSGTAGTAASANGSGTAGTTDLARLGTADLSIATDQTRHKVLTTAAKDRSADLAADRKVRTRRAQLELSLEEQRTQQELRTQQEQVRRERRDTRAARRRARVGGWINYCRYNSAAVYSLAIYAAAGVVAVSGQVSTAEAKHWPLAVGVVMALFVEGIALSMALTANNMRLQGERAIVPRALTWVAALFAASINFSAHRADTVLAAILAASSIAGITVWEIRSGAKHRPALRAAGMIPQPPASFGWRRWLRHPVTTLSAWSVQVRIRVSPAAAVLLNQAAAERAGRRQQRELRRALRWARRAAFFASLRWAGSTRAVAELTRYIDTINTRLAAAPDPIVVPVLADPVPNQVPASSRTSVPAAGTTRTRITGTVRTPDPGTVRTPVPDLGTARTPDPGTARTPDPGTAALTANGAPAVPGSDGSAADAGTEVRDITSARGATEQYVAAVWAEYCGPKAAPARRRRPDQVTWKDVEAAILRNFPHLSISKGRPGKVRQAFRARYVVADDDAEERSA